MINKGRILLEDSKHSIMAQLGRTEARITLAEPMVRIPPVLDAFPVTLEEGGGALVYRGGDGTGTGKREVAELMQTLVRADIGFTAIDTRESSLEDIFVNLVERPHGELGA